MKCTKRIFIIGLIFLSLSLNGSASQPVNPVWAGKWHTNWGSTTVLMKLEATADSLSGSYEYNDGRIRGTVQTNKQGISVLSGIWMQTGSQGWFKFMMNPDKNTFTGIWGLTEYPQASGCWNGVRAEYVLPAGGDPCELLELPYAEQKEGLSYAQSLARWEALKKTNGNSYIYQRSFSSWTGYGFTTQLRVENGVVTARAYKSFRYDGKGSKTLSEYCETGTKIGSHSEGHAPVNIDALYIEAQGFLDVDKENNYVCFTTFANGLFGTCGHVPKGCADDCFNGVTLSGIHWL